MASTKGIRAGRAYVELGTDDRLTAGLKKAQRRLRAFGAQVQAIGSKMARISGSIGIGFAVATRIFAGFDDRMRVVRAVTGATEQQFASLREEAKRLGRTTSFTAGQVAEAMTELGRAGFKPQAILDSTDAVLALARATDTELPRATEIAGAALRAFQRPASEMGRVSDVLTSAANNSAQTLDDLFEAFKPVAPIAVEAGESIEDVAAAIGVLANNGIKGSLAGNSIARAYKNLSNQAKRASLKKIGVDAVDASGNLRPLADVLNDVAKATAGMGSGDRLAIFESLFGRGQAAALKLAGSAEAFEELRDTIVNSSGAAARAAKEMDAGVGGSFRKLLSAAEGIAIAIGEAIEGPVSKAADILSKVAGWITKVVNKNRELIATIAKVTAIVFAVGTALIVAGLGIAALGAVFGGLAAIISGVGAVLGIVVAAVGALLSPVGLAVAAVVGLGAALVVMSGAGRKALDWLGDRFRQLRNWASDSVGGIIDALKSGDISLAAKIMWLSMKVAWKAGTLALKSIWNTFRASFIDITSKLWFAAVEIGADAWLSIQNGWIKMLAMMSSAWHAFVFDTDRTWQSIQADLTKGAAEIFGSDPEEIKKAQDLADAELTREMIRINAAEKKFEADQKAQKSDDLAGAQSSHDKIVRDAKNDQAITQVTINAMLEDDQSELRGELTKAQAELKAAIAEAAKNRKASDEKNKAADPPGDKPKFDPDAAIKAFEDRMAGVGKQVSDGATVRGTFNAAFAQGIFGAADAQERTANASEKTARNTKKLADLARSGGLVFA